MSFDLNLFVLIKTAVVFALGLGVGIYFRLDRVTIRDYERGLLFKNGKFTRELGPGRHNVGWGGKVNIIDGRQENFFVQQNIMTKDNILIGINLTVRTNVHDAYRAFTSSMDFRQDAHDLTRMAIRETGRKARTSTILNHEDLFERRLTKRLTPRLEDIGIELITVELIDAHLPRNIQESIADTLEDLTRKKSDKMKKVGF